MAKGRWRPFRAPRRRPRAHAPPTSIGTGATQHGRVEHIEDDVCRPLGPGRARLSTLKTRGAVEESQAALLTPTRTSWHGERHGTALAAGLSGIACWRPPAAQERPCSAFLVGCTVFAVGAATGGCLSVCAVLVTVMSENVRSFACVMGPDIGMTGTNTLFITKRSQDDLRARGGSGPPKGRQRPFSPPLKR